MGSDRLHKYRVRNRAIWSECASPQVIIELGDLELQIATLHGKAQETSDETDIELKRWLDQLDAECESAALSVQLRV